MMFSQKPHKSQQSAHWWSKSFDQITASHRPLRQLWSPTYSHQNQHWVQSDRSTLTLFRSSSRARKPLLLPRSFVLRACSDQRPNARVRIALTNFLDRIDGTAPPKPHSKQDGPIPRPLMPRVRTSHKSPLQRTTCELRRSKPPDQSRTDRFRHTTFLGPRKSPRVFGDESGPLFLRNGEYPRGQSQPLLASLPQLRSFFDPVICCFDIMHETAKR